MRVVCGGGIGAVIFVVLVGAFAGGDPFGEELAGVVIFGGKKRVGT